MIVENTCFFFACTTPRSVMPIFLILKVVKPTFTKMLNMHGIAYIIVKIMISGFYYSENLPFRARYMVTINNTLLQSTIVKL